MIRQHRRRCAIRGDDGAILVLALIVVTTISMVVGVVLTRGDGSLRATVALREVAGSTYAADGAAQIAINDLRTGYGFAGNDFEQGFNNSLDGVGCFGNNVGVGGTDQLSLDDFYPAVGSTGPTSAVVECTGEGGTGQTSSPVPINAHNKAPYALETLSGPVDASGTKDPGLIVRGGVYANGAVKGKVTVASGELRATGACDSTVTASPKTCKVGAPITDPGYTPDLGATVPALQTPPTTCANGVAIFEPGYYDNAATLTTATNLCSVAWFKPGTYYFDFHDKACPDTCPDNLFGGDTDTWTVSGRRVVGGTPIDANGNVLSQPPASASVPGACQSPMLDPHAHGVQFVFGNDSRIYIDQKSQVELCGTYHADRPPIVLYGLKTGATPTATTATGLTVGSVTSAGDFAGANADNLASAGDTKVATWTTTATAGKQSATLVAQGFQPGSEVPAGSILTGATLHITHQDADGSADSAGTTALTIGGATTAALPVPASASMTTKNVPITGGDLKSLQTVVHDNGFTGASVTYTANAKVTKNSLTATLGAISLDLTYYVPVLRGESSTCIDGTSGSCQFWSMTGGNNMSAVYFQGAIYVPAGDLSLQLGNFSTEVVKFGVVARQFEFNIVNGNIRWTGPAIEIPDDAPGYGYENTTVDLTIHLCPGKPTCTTADPVALTVRVQLWDPSGYPVPPGRQVSILSWSEQR